MATIIIKKILQTTAGAILRIPEEDYFISFPDTSYRELFRKKKAFIFS